MPHLDPHAILNLSDVAGPPTRQAAAVNLLIPEVKVWPFCHNTQVLATLVVGSFSLPGRAGNCSNTPHLVLGPLPVRFDLHTLQIRYDIVIPR